MNEYYLQSPHSKEVIIHAYPSFTSFMQKIGTYCGDRTHIAEAGGSEHHSPPMSLLTPVEKRDHLNTYINNKLARNKSKPRFILYEVQTCFGSTIEYDSTL